MNVVHLAAARGQLRNPEFALKERDFSGLRWGAITPTDIDGFLDFGDRLFVFIEAKHTGCRLRGGQRLALERLCAACNDPPRRAAVLICVESDGTERQDYSQAPIVEIFRGTRWLVPTQVVPGVRPLLFAYINALRRHVGLA